jgi:hypothetical protein
VEGVLAGLPPRRRFMFGIPIMAGRLSMLCVTKKRANGLPSTTECCSKMDIVLETT